MRRGSGLRHGSIAASRRPSPQAVSARPGNDPRLGWRAASKSPSLSNTEPVTALMAFSSFVLRTVDSRVDDADPSRASLAVPDRLARDQQDRALHTGAGPLRALPASARASCRSARGRQRDLVGRGRAHVAGRARASTATPSPFRAARCDPHDPQARLSRDRPPQSRSELQRAALAQPCSTLPALPHDSRRGRAPATPMVERVPPARARRPLLRPVQLVHPSRVMTPAAPRTCIHCPPSETVAGGSRSASLPRTSLILRRKR